MEPTEMQEFCTSIRKLVGCLSILALTAILFLGCRHKQLLSDGALADVFLRNQRSFVAVLAEYSAGRVTCSSASDVAVCGISDSDYAVAQLRKTIGIQSAYVKRSDASLWFPMETYGMLATSTSTRGYVYLSQPPQNVVQDTLGENRNGIYYRHVLGGWYIFVAN